jgi:hypothetical protein
MAFSQQSTNCFSKIIGNFMKEKFTTSQAVSLFHEALPILSLPRGAPELKNINFELLGST